MFDIQLFDVHGFDVHGFDMHGFDMHGGAMDWGADPGAGAGRERPGPAAPDPLVAAARSAIEMLNGCDPAGLDPDALARRIGDVEGLLSVLGAHQVACLAVAEERGDARASGFRSTHAWLRCLARLTPGSAKSLVALARRIDDCPATGAALSDGRISVAHAKVLAATTEELTPCFDDPAEAAKLESDLVEVAKRVDPMRLSDVCRRLRIQVAPERAADDDWAAFEQRHLSLSRTIGGLGVLDGTLDPGSTETVMAAIHAFSAPTGESDTRTPGQRRADALTEVCRRVLTFGEPPTVGGERPHVSVIVPLATLDGRAGAAPGELAWAGPVSSTVLRRILCDAAVTRIVVDGESQPLDVGRTTRVVPVGMRKALIARDRHCVYPDCDMPGVWCDAHHLRHWSDGGPTALQNLVLLCHFHHARLHITGSRIRRHRDGRTEIITDPTAVPNHDREVGRESDGGSARPP